MRLWFAALFQAWAALPWRIVTPEPPPRPSIAAERRAHLARQAVRRMRARFPDGRGIH